MDHKRYFLLLAGLLINVSAFGQNPVTTPGGTTNAIPKFSASTTIVSSAFSETSGALNWGCATSRSIIGPDQGGAIELGAANNGINCTTSGVPYIDFHFGNGLAQDFNARIKNSASNRLDFLTAANTSVPVVSIVGSNVGIGNTAPTQKLQVAGNIWINGSITADTFVGTPTISTTTVTAVTGSFSSSLWAASYSGNGNQPLSAPHGATFSAPVTVTGQATVGNIQANGAFSSFLGLNNGIVATTANGVAAWFQNTNSVPGINTGDIIQGHGVGSLRVFRVDNVGSVFAKNGYFTSGVDFAESIKVVGTRSQYTPGDVLVIATNRNERFELSSEPYSTLIAGVYSTKPGVTASPHPVMSLEQLAKEVPLGIVGIIPTKACAENGPIWPGDLLVTSSTPGYVMKGTDRNKMLGAVVGKALEPLSAGLGKIQVLVTLQ